MTKPYFLIPSISIKLFKTLFTDLTELCKCKVKRFNKHMDKCKNLNTSILTNYCHKGYITVTRLYFVTSVFIDLDEDVCNVKNHS